MLLDAKANAAVAAPAAAPAAHAAAATAMLLHPILLQQQ